MKDTKLQFFKDLLETKMNQLLGSAGKTLNQMINERDPFPDPVDRAVSESGRSIELRKRDRERKLIQKITKAIQKTDDGSYGICEECGDEISESRLRVRPEATLCIKCKKEQEEIEKQFGL